MSSHDFSDVLTKFFQSSLTKLFDVLVSNQVFLEVNFFFDCSHG